MILFLFLGLLLIGCESPSIPTTYSYINGRNNDVSSERFPIYRAKIPLHWKRLDPKLNESLEDTKKPLCTFLIENQDQFVRITIHNFPSENMQDRIAPEAQIRRWKNQVDKGSAIIIKPEARGGFSGFMFESVDDQKSVLAWAMQLFSEHYQALNLKEQLSQSQTENLHFHQKKADYTIKATGPTSLLKQHRDEIIAFAQSFELIEAI